LSELVTGDLCKPTNNESTEVANYITDFSNATSKTAAEPLTSKTTPSEKTVDSILGIKLLPAEDKKKETVRTSSSRTTHYEHSLTLTTVGERGYEASGSHSGLLHSSCTDSTEKKSKLFLTMMSRTSSSENIISKEGRYHAQAIVKTTAANHITVRDRNKDSSIGSESLPVSTTRNSFKSISSKGRSSRPSARSKTTSRKKCANTNHQLVVTNECHTSEPFFSAILPKVSQTPVSLNTSSIILTPFDILLGRGKRCNVNPGNERFRLLVDEKKPLYFQQPTKKKKNEVSIHVLESVYAYGGRFLEVTCNDPLTYQVVSDHRARKKCSQRLRDG